MLVKSLFIERVRRLGSRSEQVMVYVLHMFQSKVLKIVQFWVWGCKRWMWTSCSPVRFVVCQGIGAGMEAVEVADRVSRLLFKPNYWNLSCKVCMKLYIPSYTYGTLRHTCCICIMCYVFFFIEQTCANRLMHPNFQSSLQPPVLLGRVPFH